MYFDIFVSWEIFKPKEPLFKYSSCIEHFGEVLSIWSYDH